MYLEEEAVGVARLAFARRASPDDIDRNAVARWRRNAPTLPRDNRPTAAEEAMVTSLRGDAVRRFHVGQRRCLERQLLAELHGEMVRSALAEFFRLHETSVSKTDKAGLTGDDLAAAIS
jgi:hypothetical protein